MSHRRIVGALGLLLVVGILTACTSSFAYRHADWLLIWKVDHYFDLNRDQRTFVKDRLREHLARHRAEALPVYERALTEVKQRAADGLTREELDWMFERYQQLRADLIQQVLQDGAVLLTSMNDGQVQHLEKVLRKENDKAEREINEKADKRLAKRATTALDILTDWLGPLTREQEQRFRELTFRLPDNDHRRLGYLKAGEHELLRLLRSKRDSQLLGQRLREWLLFPGQMVPEYGRALEEMRESLKHMALAIDQMITPRQRAHALRELQDLIDDIHSLAIS